MKSNYCIPEGTGTSSAKFLAFVFRTLPCKKGIKGNTSTERGLFSTGGALGGTVAGRTFFISLWSPDLEVGMGVIAKILGLNWGDIGIMENKMQTTIGEAGLCSLQATCGGLSKL